MLSSKIIQSVFLLGLATLPGALSIPDVTPVVLPSGCASYPGFDASSQTAGPWIIQIVSSDNSTIEGFGDSVEFFRGPNAIQSGYITIPENNQLAKTALRCANNTLQGFVPTGVSSTTWENLTIAPLSYQALMMYFVGGSEIQTFEHWVDGVKQDGVFLGGFDNSTTWAFKYEPASASVFNRAYFALRLLGPISQDPFTGESLFPGEFKGFLKINA